MIVNLTLRLGPDVRSLDRYGGQPRTHQIDACRGAGTPTAAMKSLPLSPRDAEGGGLRRACSGADRCGRYWDGRNGGRCGSEGVARQHLDVRIDPEDDVNIIVAAAVLFGHADFLSGHDTHAVEAAEPTTATRYAA